MKKIIKKNQGKMQKVSSKKPQQKSQEKPLQKMAGKIESKAESKPENKKNILGINPLGDRLLVREIMTEEKETITASGIIIPVNDNANADKGSKRGEVIAVGPGKREDGMLIPVAVEAGDIILFQWGDKLVLDATAVSNTSGKDEDYYIVRESEVLAVIN